MKKSYIAGASFGLVSGVITTLGLLIGLGVGTESKVAVVGGILTIAIVDALSDAFGVHLSQESTGTHSDRYIWETTIATFLSKFSFALTFLIPIFLFKLDMAIKISMVWGFILVGYLSFLISKNNEDKRDEAQKVIFEHLALFIFIVILSYALGLLISSIFS